MSDDMNDMLEVEKKGLRGSLYRRMKESREKKSKAKAREKAIYAKEYEKRYIETHGHSPKYTGSKYFTGTQASIWIGETWVTECFGISFQATQNIIPVMQRVVNGQGKSLLR